MNASAGKCAARERQHSVLLSTAGMPELGDRPRTKLHWGNLVSNGLCTLPGHEYRGHWCCKPTTASDIANKPLQLLA